MDFKGDSPAEAAEEFLRYLERLAVAGGGLPRLTHRGLLRPSWSISGLGFRVKFQVDSALVVTLKMRTDLFSRRFGRGWVFTERTIDNLELRLDEEGQFRWYRYPGTVSRHGFVHRLRQAHWFPLTSEYLAESVAA